MKLVYLSLLFALALASLVAAQSLEVLPSSVTVIHEPGTTQTRAITINNTGNTSLSNFTFNHSMDLSDNDGDTLTVAFSNPGVLPAGMSTNVTITISSVINLDFETYGGTVTVQSGSAQDTFDLVIEAEPVVCDSGVAGSSLVLTIEDPDSNEKVKPGETIRVKANVENVGTGDIDVQVEGFLFSEGVEIKGASSDTQNIDNGDEDDFEFDITIPLDSRRLDEGDELAIFVKAFDDDSESSQCTQQKVRLSLDLDKNDVIIDEDETRLEPSRVSCGELATALVQVVNIGNDDQDDVSITVRNPSLRIDERSQLFDLEQFTSDDDDTAVQRISFGLPEDARAGAYPITLEVSFEKGKDSITRLLQVDCAAEAGQVVVPPEKVRIDAVRDLFVGAPSELLTIPLTVMNEGERATFTVLLTNVEDFAEPLSGKTITIEGGQLSTVFLNLRIRDDAVVGRYSATATVLANGRTVASDTLTVDVAEAREPLFTLDAIPDWVIIVADIVLILFLLGLVIYLFLTM